jgi:meiosis-specific protein
MARIKYTGPLSTVQLQRDPVQKQTQAEFEEVSRLKLQECLAVRQQQSMEMVRIMLHVSVSPLFTPCLHSYEILTSGLLSLVRNVILSSVCKPSSITRCDRLSLMAINREFLPLGSFDDRDLKRTQREQKYSYREFINGRARTESPEESQDLGFGKGKRGQPLKIILRNTDPKADMVLDLLVRTRALSTSHLVVFNRARNTESLTRSARTTSKPSN